MAKKETNEAARKKVTKNISKGIRWWLVLLIAILIAAIGGYFVFSMNAPQATIDTNNARSDEPAFHKEGTLAFVQQGSQDTVRIIDIEIAETPEERTQGMMYRSFISDDMGMLFIFENSQKRQFWMKNTKVSLDILFADENLQIVTIYKFTTPYSEASLPSYKEAKYVIEVSGGFTNRYNITEGDMVTFERNGSDNPA